MGGMKFIFGAMSVTVFYKFILTALWGWPGIPKILKITNMQCLCNISKELNYEVDILLTDNHESFLQVGSIIFKGMGQACPKCPGKFLISL